MNCRKEFKNKHPFIDLNTQAFDSDVNGNWVFISADINNNGINILKEEHIFLVNTTKEGIGVFYYIEIE